MGERQPMIATGWSLHLPGIDLAATLRPDLGPLTGAWAEAPAVPAAEAAAVLGRKGLLAVEPATRLALCAVHRALGLPDGQRPDKTLDPRTAVVAASNLGNVATVANVAHTVETEGGRRVSVLDAPNVSSNVLAGSVALRFGFGGPNLMVCSGPSAGLDALRLAALLLRSRRAGRVVLVGAEPDDEVAAALHAADGPARPLRAGAACLILAAADQLGPRRGGGVMVRPDPAAEDADKADIVIGPGGIDPAVRWGDHYGAADIVALALAAHLVADEGRRPVAVRGTAEDDLRRVLMS